MAAGRATSSWLYAAALLRDSRIASETVWVVQSATGNTPILMISLRCLHSKYALLHQLCPEGNEVRVVDGQHVNRGSGAAGSSQQDQAVPSKMAFPTLLPRMKQGHQVTADWIDACDAGVSSACFDTSDKPGLFSWM